MDNLLTRENFRNLVFKRDKYKCINCSRPAVDAHHIIERRLFSNGGYYLDNGASLCPVCHLAAEKTLLSSQVLREKANITSIILPEHFYSDYEYDKWGNIINSNGTRLKGELFEDKSVQKILPLNIKNSFIDYIKYPRTYHLPWSESRTNDDRTHTNLNFFKGKEIVILEKRDGENSTIYSDGYFHARSIEGNTHPSQGWLKNYFQKWYYDIPKGWRVCGENLYATHSIKYSNLEQYFEVFNLWNDKNICLSWEDTLEWCELLNLITVPILYEGIYNEDRIKELKLNFSFQEGYVIRIKDSFHYSQFKYSTAKFVRKNHVQETVHNWKFRWHPNNINNIIRKK